MNKKILILVAIFALLLIAGGAFWFMTKKAPVNQTATTNSESSSEMTKVVPTTAPAKSLRSLLTAGIAQKCTFTSGTEGDSNSGTMYISNGKIRGEYSTKVEGETQNLSMIVDGNTTYLWGGETETGYKMTIDPSTTVKPGEKPRELSFVDPDQDLNYNCTPWIVDATQFTLPANIKFSDFSNMIKPAATGGAVDKCAACSFLTGDDKTQCLSSMGCSN